MQAFSNATFFVLLSSSWNWKKPALARVQKPTPALFSLSLVTLTFDFWPQHKWVTRTRGGTLLCHVWRSELPRYLRYRVEKHRQTDRQTNAAENPIPATAVGVGYNFSWNRTWRDPSYSCRALELCRWRTICLRLRPAKHLVTACLNLPVYKDNRQIANKPMIRHDKQSLYRRHLDAPFDGCAESEPAERTGSSNVSSVQTTEDQIRYNSHRPIS